MPTTMNINSRPSIHDSNDVSSESSDSPPLQNSGESQFSGSDSEDFEKSRIRYEKDRLEMSRSVPRTPQRPPRHRSMTPYDPGSESLTTKALATKASNSSDGKIIKRGGGCTALRIGLLAGIAVIISIGVVYAYGEKNCSFDNLEKLYPEQDDRVWLALRIGIESILNKRVNEPAVYLFVHHGGHQIHKMAKDIAKHSSTCFDKKMRPVEMVNSDFTSSEATSDYGFAIEKYKMKIKKGNVILIANLNEIPPEAARAFHTICDTHSPIAKDVVIFLTLIIPHSEKGNVESVTEDTLNDLWGSKLEHNELDPLITRVTDQVIYLRS